MLIHKLKCLVCSWPRDLQLPFVRMVNCSSGNAHFLVGRNFMRVIACWSWLTWVLRSKERIGANKLYNVSNTYLPSPMAIAFERLFSNYPYILYASGGGPFVTDLLRSDLFPYPNDADRFESILGSS